MPHNSAILLCQLNGLTSIEFFPLIMNSCYFHLHKSPVKCEDLAELERRCEDGEGEDVRVPLVHQSHISQPKLNVIFKSLFLKHF